jgi:galactofuranose transport system substrate-binding protein
VSTQIEQFQNILASGKKPTILIDPVSDEALRLALQAPRPVVVPVIVLHRPPQWEVLDKSLYVASIGSDFEEEGRKAAEALVAATGGTARIIEVQGDPSFLVTIGRTKGFNDEIARHPDMHIVATASTDFSEHVARRNTGDLITANTFDAVYAEGATIARGVVAALRDADLGPGDKIKIVTVGSTNDVLQAVSEGEINATIGSRQIGATICAVQHQVVEGSAPRPAVAVALPLEAFDREKAQRTIEPVQ